MSRIAIFGGTFNPPHLGHVSLLRQVEEQMDFDEILLMPAHIPPHKQAQSLASGKDRIEMLKLAFAELPQVSICDMELKRRGKSYTVDTLAALRRQFPKDEFFFLMGTDMLMTFDRWYRWQDILKFATIVAAARGDGEEQMMRKKAEQFGDRAIVLRIAPLPMSSTEVREAVRMGAPLTPFLPEAVVSYIKAHGLYRE